MTPQELERTIEFILQHEANTIGHLERLAEGHGQMQALLVQMTELAEIQSRRLDRHDETLQSIQIWQRDALARLDAILDRLIGHHSPPS